MSNFLLQLSLGSTTVDFIDDSGGNYFLLSDTFSAPPPRAVEERTGRFAVGGERVVRKTYDNRNVSFAFMIRAANETALINAYNDVYSLVVKGSSDKASSGGIYDIGSTYETGAEVGEDGLVLRVQLHDTGGGVEDRLTFRVVSGSVSIPGIMGDARIGSVFSGQTTIERVEIELECEPFALGAPRSLAAEGSTVYGPKASVASYSRSHPRYIKVSAAEIVGSESAPIKLEIEPNVSNPTGYSSLILARESGNGVLGCPSYPVFYGSGKTEMWVFGGNDTDSIKEYKVEIDGTGSPNTFKWSDDDGSTWEATGVSITSGAIQLGSNDVYVVFDATTGYTLGGGWAFRNDQSYIDIDTYYSSIDLSARGGTGVATFYVNVPYGYAGKYKVILGVSDSVTDVTEWNMTTAYFVPGKTLSITGPKGSWVIGGGSVVHLGVLDFTKHGNSISRLPNANVMANITVFARRRDTSDTSSLNIEYALLIPVESPNSYLFSAWNSSVYLAEDTIDTYCGYDLESPVMGFRPLDEHARNYHVPFAGEVVGNVPRLEPGVDQVLYVVPVSGYQISSAHPTESYLDVSTFEYRPCYLVVG